MQILMDYQVYLFDFDYTLANSESAIIKCFRITLAKHGYPAVDDDTIRRTIGLSMEDAVSRVSGETEPDRLQWFIREYRKEAALYMTPGTFFYPDSIPTLRTLQKKGAQTAIVSTKTRDRIAEKFEQDGVTDAIDFIVGREDVQFPKPDPEGLLLAIRHFGIEKKQALYIGDSFVDAHAAQNAGLDFAAVTTGTTTAQDFTHWPHKRIMKNLSELV